MEKGKLGQEPAFACEHELNFNVNGYEHAEQDGMSKRFYAACAAMQGILANNRVTELFEKANITVEEERKYLAEASFLMADELLKQENE